VEFFPLVRKYLSSLTFEKLVRKRCHLPGIDVSFASDSGKVFVDFTTIPALSVLAHRICSTPAIEF
jgi:hypothetical protein